MPGAGPDAAVVVGFGGAFTTMDAGRTWHTLTNQLFTGQQVGTFTASAAGSFNSNQTTHFDFSAPGTYSVTQKFTIVASNGSERSARPAIGAEVPEPATWALMIGGFGLYVGRCSPNSM